jgi:hypothetical protein
MLVTEGGRERGRKGRREGDSTTTSRNKFKFFTEAFLTSVNALLSVQIIDCNNEK